VTATGPVTRNTTTDATGTYGFIDLPPGIYSISVSKTGFTTRTYTNQTLLEGQVLREDFDLGTTTVSSPAGTLLAPWNLISLPLQPVSTDPAVVFSGVDIDGKLWKWTKDTQSLVPYDSWDPGSFGAVSEDDGYWLQVGAPQTISYQAYGGAPAQNDISLASNGWSIMGMPFPSEKTWGNATVTKGGTTVSLTTAAKTNNWLSSVVWGWDNASQSLTDVGLPEDWPTSELIQPWHGYWVQTMTDGLTVTLQ